MLVKGFLHHINLLNKDFAINFLYLLALDNYLFNALTHASVNTILWNLHYFCILAENLLVGGF